MKTVFRFLPIFGAAVFLSTPAWPISFPSGPLRKDGPADLAPHPQSSKAYNEFWTYQFWLQDGMQAQLNFSRVSFGSFKDPVCGGDLSLMGFKGHSYFVAREYKLQNFAFDPVLSKLSVHQKIFFQGAPPQAHRVCFTTTKNGVAYFLDLTFDSIAPGAVWGDGVIHLHNNEQMGLFFHIPKAKVHGRIAINGDTVAVQGSAWMDHTYQTQFATNLMDAGYRYVLTSGKTEGGYFFQSEEGLFGYGLREEGGRLQLLKIQGLKPSNSNPGPWISRSLEFDFADASPSRFQLKENRQQTSAFQELSYLLRRTARMYLGGEPYSFRGTASINDSPALFSFTQVVR